MKLNKLVALTLALVMALGLAACSNSSSASETSEPTAAPENTEAAAAPAEDSSGDSEGTTSGGTVVLYHSMDDSWANPIIEEFEEKYGIQVEAISAGTSELLARVQAESANPQCDVLWSGDSGNSLDFQENYVQSYVSSEDEYYPDDYKDAVNHKWYAQHVNANMMIYNKDLVSEDEVPTSWEELCSETWKGKLYIPDPATSGTGFNHLISLMWAMADDDETRYEWLEKFAANLDGIVASGSSTAYRGCVDGEFPIGFTYEEAAYAVIEDGANVGVIYPSEGCIMARTSCQLIKDCPNQANGELLMDFLLSYDVQKEQADVDHLRSARTDVETGDGVPTLEEINYLFVDDSWINENTDKVKETFKDALYG